MMDYEKFLGMMTAVMDDIRVDGHGDPILAAAKKMGIRINESRRLAMSLDGVFSQYMAAGNSRARLLLSFFLIGYLVGVKQQAAEQMEREVNGSS